MDHSHEKTFIRRCLKALVRESPLAGDESPLDGRMDWDFLIQTAESHRVLAFVGALLEKEGQFDRLDPSLALRLKSAMGFAAWENRIRMLEFEKVRAFFQEEGIQVIPLKGVALTPLVYAKIPFRRMVDIDLLIRQKDLEKTKTFLAERDLPLKQMRNRWQAELLARAWGRYSFTDGSLDLDLQWNPRFLIGGRWVALDMERAWQRARPFPGMGKSVFIFSPMDQAIHLSLHILNDMDNSIPRLTQILDLALVMERTHVARGALLEGAAPFLDAEGRGRLARLLQAVEEGFLSRDDRPLLSKESAAFLEPFFCPILSEEPPLVPISKIIVSPWERIFYRIGYMFPSESYLEHRPYSGFRGLLACYLGHWARLIAKTRYNSNQAKRFFGNTGMTNKLREILSTARLGLHFFSRTARLTARQEFFGAKIAWVYYSRKRAPKRAFFVLCECRTGSSLFLSYLNSVPGVFFDAEIISRKQPFGLRRWGVSKEMIFRHIRHVLNYRGQEVRGAKIFFNHLEWLRISLGDLLEEFPEVRWFVLYRKDMLAQFLSERIAVKSGRWGRSRGPEPASTVQIVFDAEKALFCRDWMRRCYQDAIKNEALRERSLWISYEDLVKEPQKLFDEKIFPFLKLPKSRVSTDRIKQNLRSPSELISNYAEVREFIEQTDFTQSYGVETESAEPPASATL